MKNKGSIRHGRVQSLPLLEITPVIQRIEIHFSDWATIVVDLEIDR